MSDSEIKPLSWWMRDEEDGDYDAMTVGGQYLLEAEEGSYHLLEHIYDSEGGVIKSVARGPLEDLKTLADKMHEESVRKWLTP